MHALSAATILRWLPLGLLVSVGALVIGAMLSLHPRPKGDGCEYAQMTESFLNHLTPDARPEDFRPMGRWCWDFAAAEKAPYFRGRDGRLYSWHFWGYSLAAVPVKGVLRLLGSNELRAFQITNALLFVAALACVLMLAALGPVQRLVLGLLTAFSPAFWFVHWPHPEVFVYSLVTMALVFAGRAEWGRAIALVSLASWQSPPLVLLAGLFWLRAVAAGDTPLGGALRASLAALPVLVPPLFSLAKFGTLSLLAREAASARNISAHRVQELLIDPNMGMAPYIPIAFALFLGIVVRDIAARRRCTPAVQYLVVMLAMMAAAASTGNWNSDTAGPSRYVVWMFPLVFAVVAGEPLAWPPRSVRAGAYQVAVALALLWPVFLFSSTGGFFVSRVSWLRHTGLASFVLRQAPAWYNPTAELFLKRTLSQEPVLDPFAIFWDRGRCRKVLVRWSERARLERVCGGPPSSTRDAPQGGTGEDRFIYGEFPRPASEPRR